MKSQIDAMEMRFDIGAIIATLRAVTELLESGFSENEITIIKEKECIYSCCVTDLFEILFKLECMEGFYKKDGKPLPLYSVNITKTQP